MFLGELLSFPARIIVRGLKFLVKFIGEVPESCYSQSDCAKFLPGDERVVVEFEDCGRSNVGIDEVFSEKSDCAVGACQMTIT